MHNAFCFCKYSWIEVSRHRRTHPEPTIPFDVWPLQHFIICRTRYSKPNFTFFTTSFSQSVWSWRTHSSYQQLLLCLRAKSQRWKYTSMDITVVMIEWNQNAPLFWLQHLNENHKKHLTNGTPSCGFSTALLCYTWSSNQPQPMEVDGFDGAGVFWNKYVQFLPGDELNETTLWPECDERRFVVKWSLENPIPSLLFNWSMNEYLKCECIQSFNGKQSPFSKTEEEKKTNETNNLMYCLLHLSLFALRTINSTGWARICFCA